MVSFVRSVAQAQASACFIHVVSGYDSVVPVHGNNRSQCLCLMAHTHTHTHTHKKHKHTHTQTHTNTHLHTHIHTHIHTHLHTHTHTYTHIHTHLHGLRCCFRPTYICIARAAMCSNDTFLRRRGSRAPRSVTRCVARRHGRVRKRPVFCMQMCGWVSKYYTCMCALDKALYVTASTCVKAICDLI